MEDKKLREHTVKEILNIKTVLEGHQKVLKDHNEILQKLNEKIELLMGSLTGEKE